MLCLTMDNTKIYSKKAHFTRSHTKVCTLKTLEWLSVRRKEMRMGER